jgi:hypothetical protein
MDRKIFDYSELLNFPTNATIGSATISPISNIKGPFTCYFFQANPTYTSIASIALGTVVAYRQGETVKYKFYGWRLRSTGTADLVRTEEIEKGELPYHYSDEIPDWDNRSLL